MTPANLLGLTALVQLFQRELADRLQHLEAQLAMPSLGGPNQTVIDEIFQPGQRRKGASR